jgi:hypothetical protein
MSLLLAEEAVREASVAVAVQAVTGHPWSVNRPVAEHLLNLR